VPESPDRADAERRAEARGARRERGQEPAAPTDLLTERDDRELEGEMRGESAAVPRTAVNSSPCATPAASSAAADVTAPARRIASASGRSRHRGTAARSNPRGVSGARVSHASTSAATAGPYVTPTRGRYVCARPHRVGSRPDPTINNGMPTR